MASGMKDLRSEVHELAVNQVALGKAQVPASMQTCRRLSESGCVTSKTIWATFRNDRSDTDETVDRLGIRVDRLVQALENRFGANGSRA